MDRMDGDNKTGTGLHRIIAPEAAQRLALKEYAAIKLMQVAVERDAALLERNNAIAEKKVAFAERDFAVLQRDVAYADRDNAIIERDAAVAALELERGTRSSQESKDPAVSQMNAPDLTDFGVGQLHAFADDGPMVGAAINCGVLHPPEKQDMQTKKKQNSKPRQSKKISKRATDSAPKPARKRKRNQGSQPEQGVHEVHNEQLAQKENTELRLTNFQIHHSVQEQANARIVTNLANKPTPYCSCTGLNQQCYRWGNGGWQSACCTTALSVYPLPMHPKRKGYRLPGRKMSAGAFRKLRERLVAEGVDLSQPLDLKNYWARHGTNRYVTIK